MIKINFKRSRKKEITEGLFIVLVLHLYKADCKASVNRCQNHAWQYHHLKWLKLTPFGDCDVYRGKWYKSIFLFGIDQKAEAFVAGQPSLLFAKKDGERRLG